MRSLVPFGRQSLWDRRDELSVRERGRMDHVLPPPEREQTLMNGFIARRRHSKCRPVIQVA